MQEIHYNIQESGHKFSIQRWITVKFGQHNTRTKKTQVNCRYTSSHFEDTSHYITLKKYSSGAPQHSNFGFKYTLSTVQCSAGKAELKNSIQFIAGKRNSTKHLALQKKLLVKNLYYMQTDINTLSIHSITTAIQINQIKNDQSFLELVIVGRAGQ